MIIFRYIAREVLGVFLLTSFVLLLIFLSNQFVRYLGLAASGKLLGWQLLHLILLEIPQLLSLIFPLGLYLSILLVYGRLYADHEMVILTASGFSQQQLFKMTFILAAIVALPVMLFTLWMNPVIANQRDKLLAQISATSILQTLLPGRFQEAEGGNQIFYIEKMSNDRQSLKSIFAAQKVSPQDDHWTVMEAQSGHYLLDPKTKDHFVVAQNGYRYEGVPGEKNFKIYHFAQYGVRLDVPVSYIRNSEIDSVSVRDLWRGHENPGKKLDYDAELQWRLSLPLCVFILAFLAASLSYVKPREGRFAKFFPAILIYVIYANFMIAGQDWISSGALPPVIGLWSVHISMVLLALILYLHRENILTKYWVLLCKR